MAAVNSPLLLGLDLGISTVKAGLFALDGSEVALVAAEYLQMPEGASRFEVDPESLWQAIVSVARRALGQVDWGAGRVAGVSVASHAETMVFLREDGTAVRPAIMSPDSRAEQEARELAEALGRHWLLERTGQPEVIGMYPAPKLAWLRRHEPDALAQSAHILMPNDYVLFRLSGALAGEPTAWLSSMMLGLDTSDWLDPVLAFAGVVRQQLPTIVAPGTVVGSVTARAAAETGLPLGVPVVAGAMDQICAALAAGNIRPGIVTASTGSVIALVATTVGPILDPVTKVPCYPHAMPGKFCLLPWNPTGGLVLKWFKDRFVPRQQVEAERGGASVYDLLTSEAAGVPPGSDGLLMLPHLEGIIFPETNPAARGVFFGISLSHGRGHFVRAIMEAIAYMLRSGIESLRGLGVQADEVRLLGGGARSPLWLRIMADVCQVPVLVPRGREAAAMGAALLAAVGAGIYPDIPSAVEAMVQVQERVEPDLQMLPVYDECYAKYLRLYEQLRPLFTSSDR